MDDFIEYLDRRQKRLDELIANEELFLSDHELKPAYMLSTARYMWVRTDAAVAFLRECSGDWPELYPQAKGLWYWKTCIRSDGGEGDWADAEKDCAHLRDAIRSLFQQKKEG
jgi:hypothetical protein